MVIVSIGIGFHAGTDRRLSAGSCYGGPGFRRSVEARVSGWNRLKRGLIGLGRPCPLCFRRRGRWEPHAPPRVAWVNTGAMTDSVALLSVPSRSPLGPLRGGSLLGGRGGVSTLIGFAASTARWETNGGFRRGSARVSSTLSPA